MEKYFSFLLKLPLFDGVEAQHLPNLLQCLQARIVFYAKGDSVFLQGDAVSAIAIVLTGSVLVIKDEIGRASCRERV